MNAIRRHHRERLRQRMLDWEWVKHSNLKPADLGRYIDTPHPCSRVCCRNPRRYGEGATVQERRSFTLDDYEL
jgi:hypothetical protein